MNKKTAAVGSYTVSLEEATSKLKVEHKSNFFSFRLFVGPQINSVFKIWSEQSEAFTQIFDIIKVVVSSALNIPDYAFKLRQFHIDYTDSMVKAAPVLTKDEDDIILKEVQDEYNESIKAKNEWIDKGIVDAAKYEARASGYATELESGKSE